MSDNYKTIARTKEVTNKLKELGWSETKVLNEIGIAHKLFKDIMEMDPVSITIYAKSVDKLRAFIEKHGAILDKPTPAPGVHSGKREDPFPVIPKKPPPPPSSNGDPLAELDRLVEKFEARGYKLETKIIKINQTA